MRVVLCNWRALDRLLEVNVDGWGMGLLSMVAIIWLVSVEAVHQHEMSHTNETYVDVLPAVIAFRCSLGRDGPTGPCCADSGAGSSLTSLNSSFILTDNRMRALKIDIRQSRHYHGLTTG